jgi:hypothetical protein
MKTGKYLALQTLLIIILTGNLFGQNNKSLLRFTASFSDNQDSPDYSVVYFDQKATAEFNGQLDAFKLLNTDISVPSLFILTPANVKISIKAIPYASDTTYTIPLGLILNKAGNMIFRIKDITGLFSEMKISVTDKSAGVTQDLLDNKEYQISLDTGEYTDRFILNISNKTTETADTTVIEPDVPEVIPDQPEVVTGISETTETSENFTIWYVNDILNVEILNFGGREGYISLFNLSGQRLFMKKIKDGGHHEFAGHLKNGIYMVSFSSATMTITKKVLVINR